MNFEKLFENYQLILDENAKLKEEIKNLKAKLGIFGVADTNATAIEGIEPKSVEDSTLLNVTEKSEPVNKINLFMSLFKGRDDVYAKRWQNKKGKSGYSPVCLNEWKKGFCKKFKNSKAKCGNCDQRVYDTLDEKVIENHLKGEIVAGIFPLCLDETCYFLAIDFDDESWQKDITVVRDVCGEFNIPVYVERSRSGNGAHLWFFFKNTISAIIARKLGSALLTYSMSKRHELSFKSYDRLFPSQDTMPKGGLGNLIALPLQKAARSENNSVFIDENFKPYKDQWSFLNKVRRLTENEVEIITLKLCQGNELGELKQDDADAKTPWKISKVQLLRNDFPQEIRVVKANMLFIPKLGISPKALNYLKRLAAFKNPEFYRAQAMRLPTYNKPRIISCCDETEEYLCLPRGCEKDLRQVFIELEIEANFADESNSDKSINVEFNGSLREEQSLALNEMLKHENGVLSLTTGSGKTVVAIKLIAERKVNTLILVDKVSLLTQWRNELSEFLTINEPLPELNAGKKGRKLKSSIIGQIGEGKNNLTGVIDIGIMQSINRLGEVKDCVKDYSMVIVDECHHVSAFSFEEILKNVNAKYVYGLSATPIRKDGHHPIIFMQCGPIRYMDDAKKQAEKRPFEHYIIPRFTSLRVPLDKNEKEVTIQELYSEIVNNEIRNQQIVDDVVKCYESGRNCIILTERTAHVQLLFIELSKRIPDVISLTGGMSTKKTRETFTRIDNTPAHKQLVLVATGKYIGEGFDEPRLDTLFLAMPISWKGTLQQYAGRLHRLFMNKNEVQIYDYVDVHVKMLEKMYNKRLNGYASIGYKAKGESNVPELIDIIFDARSFLPIYKNDIASAVEEVLIVSPYVSKRQVSPMLNYLNTALSRNVKIMVVTRSIEDIREKNKVAAEKTIGMLETCGVKVFFKQNLFQKFAIIDRRIVWYGSINLLGLGNTEESIMRLESPGIADELIGCIKDSI